MYILQELDPKREGTNAWVDQAIYPTLAEAIYNLADAQGGDVQAILRVLHRVGDDRLTERIVYE